MVKFASVVALVAPLAAAAPAPAPQEVPNIVGGTSASAGEFPFIVSISRNGGPWCGGALLNADTVLTAAHCVYGYATSGFQIRAGSLSRTSGGVTSRLSSARVHPNYGSSSSTNDVAILKLSTSIPASGSIGYATLAASGSDPAAGAQYTVAGWGATSEGGTSTPVNLLKVTVPVVSRATCRSQYSSSAITDSMFCAGLSAGGKDSCQGDSGGPIVDSSKVLQGVVSWGDGCARPNKPGVYARIGALRSFIDTYA
ncbi:AChain A Fusarium Oxysporum trypsin At Atomic Resolution [Fusarium beomiforme]|uniref:AChain A Fusarium Oxysporum trypsin At Atomic Resolution n=1 Tax=Fusarium beomiforme TaxID=44412 RepID=A0A9P5DYI5_9HYPO|nr:AChain A Fusarium Oxysporum trypsin At Atomic Resolution [Fusarium beomiforme]